MEIIPPTNETRSTTTQVPVTPPVEELVDIDYVMKIKFRVATIETAESVPKSKKLIKLGIDLGEFGKRQILAGISTFYNPETLIGKQIVVVANLKPATLMGLESQGMLLAASTADGATLALVCPESPITPGSVVR